MANGRIELPPIRHEAKAAPHVMTPEQSAAYEEYMNHRPADPVERTRLRRIISDQAQDSPAEGSGSDVREEDLN